MTPSAYVDEFPSCARTHATLQIYIREPRLDAIGQRLGLTPTATSDLGARMPGKPWGWQLSTASTVTSRDLRRHLDGLLDALEPRRLELEAIRRELHAYCAVSAYWEQANGYGGPMLMPSQMRRLAELDLHLSFELRATSGDAGP